MAAAVLIVAVARPLALKSRGSGRVLSRDHGPKRRAGGEQASQGGANRDVLGCELDRRKSAHGRSLPFGILNLPMSVLSLFSGAKISLARISRGREKRRTIRVRHGPSRSHE